MHLIAERIEDLSPLLPPFAAVLLASFKLTCGNVVSEQIMDTHWWLWLVRWWRRVGDQGTGGNSCEVAIVALNGVGQRLIFRHA